MNRLLAFGFSAALLFASAVALAQDAKAPASMPMMTQMDEHMAKMQALHDRMTGAATPEERQKAMQDARKQMQEGMAMMKPMMQSGGMMGGGMMAQNEKGADTAAQMQMMRKRMDMMQMMMQMMMDEQGMMAWPKAGDAPAKK
jgi:hypothetical protein